MAAPNKITFTGSTGDELAARLDKPPGRPRAYAIFAHCFTCGKDIAAASRISSGLVAAGIAVLRFDFTGLGSSQGEFANTNFSSNVADLVAAAAMLRERHEAPALLVGHSLGGAAVLAAAGQVPEVRAVATIGAPFDPMHVTGLIDDESLARIRADGEAEVTLAGRPFRIQSQFLDDVSGQRLSDAIGGLKRPLMVMHSPIDQLVGVDNARQIYEAARHPKSFVSLDTADHLLTNKADATYVAGVLSVWASRYLTDPPPDGPAEPPDEGSVVVEETDIGTYAQQVRAGNHTFAADEPIGIGDDTGPTPYDLLLAGLGACTSMTLRMYADRKKMALSHVRVTLRHERVHATDCGGVEGNDCDIGQISRTIEVEGDLSDADRTALHRIADRCPVHRTLEGEIRVETTLA